MNKYQFMAAVIEALAWPTCLLGVILILRRAYQQDQYREDEQRREREARHQAGQS